MVQISGVIITFNEEKNIERCLKSLEGVVDEVVVLDSFSTDRTEEICQKNNVKFLQHEFDGHIQQKNRAKDMAAYDYVLSLDADEALSEKLKVAILSAKENWQYDGYSFNRLASYCGKWIKHSWYPDPKLRLWDRKKGQWGGMNPHDTFVMNKDTTTTHLQGDLLHYSFYTIEEHIQQINKFSTISAQTYYMKGRRGSVCALLFRPFWRFIRDYFFKLGFLDGFYGFVVCRNTAHEVFLKYSKLRHLYKINDEK